MFCDTIRTNLLFIYQQYNILFCKESRKFKKERTFKGLFLVFCGGTWYDKKVFDALISEDSVLR